MPVIIHQLETLRERRPPWPRQTITPILPTVKILSLGGERLPPPPPKKKKKKKKRFWVCFKHVLLISKQVKNLYKWTSIRR